MQEFTNALLKYSFSSPIVWIFIALAILSALFYKKIVGKAGKHHVKSELKKLSKEKYYIINDLIIEVNNITHQVDHVVRK